VLSYVTYSRSHRQAGALTINIHSALRTASDVCNNLSLAVFFGSSVVHVHSLRSLIWVSECACVCTHEYMHACMFFTIYRLCYGSECRLPRKSFCVRKGLPDLVWISPRVYLAKTRHKVSLCIPEQDSFVVSPKFTPLSASQTTMAVDRLRNRIFSGHTELIWIFIVVPKYALSNSFPFQSLHNQN
jgi:hypothetical protein